MPHIRTEIVLSAPPARVFATLADFARWGEWNPVIPKIRATPAVERGAKVAFTIVIPGLPKLPIVARLVAFEPGRRLAWAGGLRPALHGEHYFELTPDGAGTRLVHGEDFTGAFARLMPGAIVNKITAAYDGANRALRDALA